MSLLLKQRYVEDQTAAPLSWRHLGVGKFHPDPRLEADTTCNFFLRRKLTPRRALRHFGNSSRGTTGPLRFERLCALTSYPVAHKAQAPCKCCCTAADESANRWHREPRHKSPDQHGGRDSVWSRPMRTSSCREQSRRQARLLCYRTFFVLLLEPTDLLTNVAAL
jgi:hypothetical protein